MTTPSRPTKRSVWLRTTAAVAVSAIAGSVVTDPQSRWYRGLDLPSWQPPPLAFPIVWTALYADIAAVSVATVNELHDDGQSEEAKRYERALWLNLALNSGWSALFFAGHKPGLATFEAAALTVSSADLVRRVGAVDSRRGAALAPYAAWCGFATVLTTVIWRRNRTT